MTLSNTVTFFIRCPFFIFPPAGMQFSPSHGRLSVLTGLRIYTAHNNPKADPIKYQIRGRHLGGANIKDRFSKECWQMNDIYRINPSPNCDPSSPSQKFYMNDLGEIRVKSLPGRCLDPSFGMDATNQGSIMRHCFSDEVGANVDDVKGHKFTYDPSTEQFESVQYSGHCVDYDVSLGYIRTLSCNDTPNQRFYFRGDFANSSEGSWNAIVSGDLPWISEFHRNSLHVAITSSYESSDENLYSMEAKFFDNITVQ